MDEFRAFGLATNPFFPRILSDEDMSDPLHRALLANPSEMWQAGWGDEELTYKLERCIYTFFRNGLSVFDNFAYALYFLGYAIQPATFPDVAKLRNITRKATRKAFDVAFPRNQSRNSWRVYRATQNSAPLTSSGIYWVTG
jgi:hypothetical protein